MGNVFVVYQIMSLLNKPVISVIMVFYHLSLCTSVKFTLIQVMVMFVGSRLSVSYDGIADSLFEFISTPLHSIKICRLKAYISVWLFFFFFFILCCRGQKIFQSYGGLCGGEPFSK